MHLLMKGGCFSNRNGSHEGRMVMAVDSCKFQGKLVLGVKMTASRKIAAQERIPAGAAKEVIP